MNLYHAFHHAAQEFGGRIALECEHEELTYRELDRRCIHFANGLRARIGSLPANIAFLMPNTIPSVTALMSIFYADCTAVPFNPALLEHELAALLDHSDSPVLLYEEACKDKALAAVSLAKREIQAVSMHEITAQEPVGSPLPPPQAGSGDTALILYTSGTTGAPKGVMLTHNNIHSNYAAFKERVGLHAGQTLLAILPIFHSFGITTIIFGGLLTGARVVLYPAFAPRKVVQALLTRPDTVVAGVPPMLHMLTRSAPAAGAKTHQIHSVISGGGPLPAEFFAAFKDTFHHEIIEGYGLTETAPVVAHNANGINKPGTIGPPLPGVEVQIRNESGDVMETEAIGELCVKGPLVMKGYYKNQDATKAVFYDNKWFRTGDLAQIDADGYIRIVGRCKDLIVSGGKNIYPREIEEVLLTLPGIEEAAVVGKPDPLRAEVPYAFVVLKEGCQRSETEIRAACRTHLSTYKIPTGVQCINEMPKTATKKIQKERLKEKYFI